MCLVLRAKLRLTAKSVYAAQDIISLTQRDPPQMRSAWLVPLENTLLRVNLAIVPHAPRTLTARKEQSLALLVKTTAPHQRAARLALPLLGNLAPLELLVSWERKIAQLVLLELTLTRKEASTAHSVPWAPTLFRRGRIAKFVRLEPWLQIEALPIVRIALLERPPRRLALNVNLVLLERLQTQPVLPSVPLAHKERLQAPTESNAFALLVQSPLLMALLGANHVIVGTTGLKTWFARLVPTTPSLPTPTPPIARNAQTGPCPT